jgi:hypothetical protein
MGKEFDRFGPIRQLCESLSAQAGTQAFSPPDDEKMSLP